MQVDHLGIRVLLQQVVAHRMHQVGLAEADAAIQEQRVVAVLGVVGHLPGGGARQLVRLALDEVLEGEGAVQVAGVFQAALDLHGALGTHQRRALHFGHRLGRRRFGAGHRAVGRRRFKHRRGRHLGHLRRGGGRRRARGSGTLAADQQGQRRRLAVAALAHQFEQATDVFLVDPVEHETVGRVHAQLVAVRLDLQRTDPGVELLGRQLVAQNLHALLPQFHGHSVSLARKAS
ncbi:hypothetical protein D3C80_906880 [compost metagenome]